MKDDKDDKKVEKKEVKKTPVAEKIVERDNFSLSDLNKTARKIRSNILDKS